MPRPRKEFPSESFDVQFNPIAMNYLRTRFRDPASRRGIKHGAISEYVNRLVLEDAHRNPLVSAEQLKPQEPSA